jgi:hypothetical protein
VVLSCHSGKVLEPPKQINQYYQTCFVVVQQCINKYVCISICACGQYIHLCMCVCVHACVSYAGAPAAVFTVSLPFIILVNIDQ